MPRRKSIKKVAKDFQSDADAVKSFVEEAGKTLSAKHTTWAYEFAIIRLYRDFEDLILNALKGAINNDPSTISSVTNIDFGQSLSDAVCEYLIVGSGYFDFKGRDGLIKTIKKYVPDSHYLVTILKKDKYKDSLGRLSALRNYAAHDSKAARAKAKDTVGQQRIGPAGAWLKRNGRLETIATKLSELAAEIEQEAPY